MKVTLVGANRRRVDDLFRHAGGTITHVRCTGEVRYSHPLLERPITANARRKDTTRLLTKAVLRLTKMTSISAEVA